MLRFDRNEIFTAPADVSGREKMIGYVEQKHGLIKRQVIARSILSRPIEACTVGEGKKHIVVVAAHHALESITVNLTYLLIDTLLGFSKSDAVKGINCKLLLSKYRFIIVPCVNPDGIEMRFHGTDNSPLRDRQNKMSGGDYTRWQSNARGVDLNHNYNSRFNEYKVLEREMGISAGPSLYSGEYPESEPEVKGIAGLIRATAPVAVVSLHSQGEEIYGFPASRRTARYLDRLATLTGYAAGVPSGTAAYGGLCDYTGSLGIPSFTYEVGQGENPLPEAQVFPIFDKIAESIILLPSII